MFKRRNNRNRPAHVLDGPRSFSVVPVVAFKDRSTLSLSCSLTGCRRARAHLVFSYRRGGMGTACALHGAPFMAQSPNIRKSAKAIDPAAAGAQVWLRSVKAPSRNAIPTRAGCLVFERRPGSRLGCKIVRGWSEHRLPARQPDGRTEQRTSRPPWQAFMLEKGTGTVFPAAVSAAAPNSQAPSKWRDGAGRRSPSRSLSLSLSTGATRKFRVLISRARSTA